MVRAVRGEMSFAALLVVIIPSVRSNRRVVARYAGTPPEWFEWLVNCFEWTWGGKPHYW